MSESTLTHQDIYQQILELPQDTLADLAKYIEFLRFRAGETQAKAEVEKPLRIVDLEGFLEGYDFSPEFIAGARREMWGNFPRDIEFDVPVEER